MQYKDIINRYSNKVLVLDLPDIMSSDDVVEEVDKTLVGMVMSNGKIKSKSLEKLSKLLETKLVHIKTYVTSPRNDYNPSVGYVMLYSSGDFLAVVSTSSSRSMKSWGTGIKIYKKLHKYPIVFLDIDGVLNIMGESYRTHKYMGGIDAMEPHLVRRLEFIFDRVTDARIVISSSWRNDEVVRMLNVLKFKHTNKIIGRTPRGNQHRGEQIKEWLDTHQPDSTDYIVLEDEVSVVCGDSCDIIPIDNVIEVDMNEGFSNKNTLDAVFKLNHLDMFKDSKVKYSVGLVKELIDNGYVLTTSHKVSELKEDDFDYIIHYPNTLKIRLLRVQKDSICV